MLLLALLQEEHFSVMSFTTCSIGADIVEGRLESAKLVGADVTINCKTENLKERGS